MLLYFIDISHLQYDVTAQTYITTRKPEKQSSVTLEERQRWEDASLIVAARAAGKTIALPLSNQTNLTRDSV
ncbi:hypothetical protein J6590_107243, partial [Homalodisca vitripennis]